MFSCIPTTSSKSSCHSESNAVVKSTDFLSSNPLALTQSSVNICCMLVWLLLDHSGSSFVWIVFKCISQSLWLSCKLFSIIWHSDGTTAVVLNFEQLITLLRLTVWICISPWSTGFHISFQISFYCPSFTCFDQMFRHWTYAMSFTVFKVPGCLLIFWLQDTIFTDHRHLFLHQYVMQSLWPKPFGPYLPELLGFMNCTEQWALLTKVHVSGR